MTNTYSHTPAPWFTKEGAIYGEDGATLARVPFTIGDAQDEANANLICAAPDLLEALILLEERSSTLPAHSEFMAKARNKARDAINKAREGINTP